MMKGGDPVISQSLMGQTRNQGHALEGVWLIFLKKGTELNMWDFILTYWLEVLFGILSAILIGWVKNLQNKLKKKQAEQDALNSGMIAILHDRLFEICTKYLSLGYIPVDESEEILDNAKMIYDAYHGIGGNGTGTAIYEKFENLKIRS